MSTDPFILQIETATTVCSVALSRGKDLVAHRELDEGYTHAENLHLFIKNVLEEAGETAAHLHAVALSSGPGSYTGLRIGSSTAKGLCFALDIPLIAIGTLKLMAAGMRAAAPGASYYCPMIDAGRMEVYTAVFDNQLRVVQDPRAVVLDETSVRSFSAYSNTCFGGKGMEKARTLLADLPGSHLLAGIRPSATFMPELSYTAWQNRNFSEIADFEPFYLKNYRAGKQKKPF